MFYIYRIGIMFDFLLVYLYLFFKTTYTLFELDTPPHVLKVIAKQLYVDKIFRLIKRFLYCLLRSLSFLYRNVIAFYRYPTFYFVALAHSVHKSGLNKLFRNNASP